MTIQVGYEEFVALLDRMVKRRESGSLFVRTDSNHSVIIGVDDGEIVALVAGNKRGLSALGKITGFSSCSVKLDADSVVDFHRGELPASDEILYRLSHRLPPETDGVESVSQGETGSLLAGAPGESIDSVLAGSILCELLSDYLGPIAPMICDEATDGGKSLRTPDQLVKAINALASEIESAPEARDFSDKAYSRCSHWLK